MADLTSAIKQDILQRLSEGESLRAACRVHKLTAGSFLNAMLRDDSGDLREQYASAREVGVDSQAEEMHDLEMAVLSGDLDPNAFRAAMDARKWRLARQHPRKYGDKQSIEQKTTHSGSVEIVTTISPELMSMLQSVYDTESPE